MEIALAVTIVLLVVVIVLQIVGLMKQRGGGDASRFDNLDKEIDRIDRSVREEFGRNREEASNSAKAGREEITKSFESQGKVVSDQMSAFGKFQTEQLESFAKQLTTLTQTTEQKLDRVRGTVDERLKQLQEENTKKLDQMRATVDEKLQSTLEKRIGESFKQVSERLELVHKGLGEMHELANGVGDLKRVMTNVKMRGTWGEVLLGNLLEQVLTPDQYEKNCKVRPRSDVTVEYAIKLPGPDDDANTPVYLPIDAKFPKEAYERIVAASEAADKDQLEQAQKELESAVFSFARDIRDKYIAPPHTTDFALLFVPTEGLYAELIRRPGLVDRLQRECRVNLTGPTTLLALLNSLQMGFRTLAIQKRSSEVWKLLGAVKTEFGRFEDWIDAVTRKLNSAVKEMDKAAVRTRQINRRLSKVEETPVLETQDLLEQNNGDEIDEGDEIEV